MKQGYDFLAIGNLHSADFDEGTITLKVHGDMPPLSSGRYAIAHFDKFSSTVRMAKLWTDQQEKMA
jgi:hypothetical protein